jgi:hypothetical protein
MRSLLLKMTMLADTVKPSGGSTHPYYRRSMPAPQGASRIYSNTAYIDLRNAHLPPYGVSNPVADAVGLFDARAAAAVSAAVAFMRFIPWGVLDGGHFVRFKPPGQLLEVKSYGGIAPDVAIPTADCLAAMAYPDYFPAVNDATLRRNGDLRRLVSEAILAANPGWAGAIGPAIHDVITYAVSDSEGNYDMSQMHLLQIVYRYYDELQPDVREFLISILLARGRIHRVNEDDTFTSGGVPNDWSRAGYISPLGYHVRIGETENHIMTIHTARYLTNQLLYQRDHDPSHDNRRNGSDDAPTCTELMLSLLRNILRDDFSEYNAKNYQTQTRYALLNLCSYAYDHEVRLAARMVLDYVSAHTAVSSNDLRRMVPFRRRNEGKNVMHTPPGFMNVSLLETTFGADPMAQHFAMLAGNTRIYQTRNWHIKTDGTDGNDAVMYALSDYRLPPSIHDLFVNDLHRRFFQTLHRGPQDDVTVTGRNCDNHEIYAGSPSYLITAGGSPADYAIDPDLADALSPDKVAEQLGVAVTTSFIPTMRPNLDCGDPTQAIHLIQFGRFAEWPGVYNGGVAPDFACGPQVNLPQWCTDAIAEDRRKHPNDSFGKFQFVDKRSAGDGPGFFLAFFIDGAFAVMEAWDTWLHPELSIEQFKETVFRQNKDLTDRGLPNPVTDQYRTANGNLVHFAIENNDEFNFYGARVLSIDYSSADAFDSFGNSGPDRFLSGTVMNSLADGVVEITNHFLGSKITLDMSDQWHPRRTSETGEVEEAGSNHEVWVNFGWTGPSEGNFFRPFNTITAAAAAVADGGVIKIVPGWTNEKPFFPKNKRIQLVAPIGGVNFGVR